MLENAKLHRDELQNLFYKIWYDPKYQFYFGGDSRYSLGTNQDDPNRRQFVSLNNKGEIIGYFSYRINSDVRLAESFGAIHFGEDYTITFARDLRQLIDDCFEKFGIRTLEFAVICGNPAEASYDKIVEKLGGRILCRRSGRALDLQGNIHDDKLYEITRSQYLSTKQRRHQK